MQVPLQDAEVACSFCLRPQSELGRLVQGPAGYICAQCIAACSDVLSAMDQPAPGRPPWERALSDDELLAQLPRLAVVASQADRALQRLVQRGRAQGITWTRLGAALGMTRQSAWERFSEAT